MLKHHLVMKYQKVHGFLDILYTKNFAYDCMLLDKKDKLILFFYKGIRQDICKVLYTHHPISQGISWATV